jgi:cyclopropane-fatty-acyl-phospholipid synthase
MKHERVEGILAFDRDAASRADQSQTQTQPAQSRRSPSALAGISAILPDEDALFAGHRAAEREPDKKSQPFAEFKLLGFLLDKTIDGGILSVVDPAGAVHRFGKRSGRDVTVRISDRGALRRLAVNPALAVGETYMEGSLTIESGTLDDFLFLCTLAVDNLEQLPFMRAWRKLAKPFRALQQQNAIGAARENISSHYDISGEIYDLFLDADRQYSCAYFEHGDETLEQAQEKKKRHIAKKLCLQAGMKVLDIGSGWGGLSIEMAQSVSGLQVTGLTLSHEQLAVSQRRAAEAGLSDRVKFFLKDYRDETGQYDRVVSVGMFEHVGISNYQTYFRQLRNLLTPSGVALLHAIGRMDAPAETNGWVRKYIFPGGYCPALSEVFAAIEKSTLWATDVEILRLHYAFTLHEWARRFEANRARAAEIYDERFCRMWEFYLKISEAAFRYSKLMVFQIQLTRQRDAVPLTRNYMC